jgi:hypothetical protein
LHEEMALSPLATTYLPRRTLVLQGANLNEASFSFYIGWKPRYLANIVHTSLQHRFLLPTLSSRFKHLAWKNSSGFLVELANDVETTNCSFLPLF